MNILLINHYAGSIRHGMEYRPYYMARKWMEQGHEVTIVAASYSHLRSEAPRLNGGTAEETIDGVRYLWLRTPAYQGNGARRAVNMLSFVARLSAMAPMLAERFRPEAVIASSTYPLDIVPASRIAERCGARLVYEVHDLWPLSPIELGGISPGHPFMRLLQWAEDYAYRKADRVVSMLPKAAEHMMAHGMAPEKFAYVPNGVVAEEWSQRAVLPETHERLLRTLKAEGSFLVGYAGSHGTANALEWLIRSVPLVDGLPVRFVLVGQGPEKERLQLLARRFGGDGVLHFLPPVPKSAVPELLRRMDALYIGFRRSPLYRFGVSPNKLMDYMMSGKPVINALEAGNDPIAESGGGLSIPPEHPEAVADAVRKLWSMSEAERRRMGERAKRYVLEKHDYRVLAGRFIEVMGGAK